MPSVPISLVISNSVSFPTSSVKPLSVTTSLVIPLVIILSVPRMLVDSKTIVESWVTTSLSRPFVISSSILIVVVSPMTILPASCVV